jgi:hypothetical protein
MKVASFARNQKQQHQRITCWQANKKSKDSAISLNEPIYGEMEPEIHNKFGHKRTPLEPPI